MREEVTRERTAHTHEDSWLVYVAGSIAGMELAGAGAHIRDKGIVRNIVKSQPEAHAARVARQEPTPTRGPPATPRAHTVDLGQVGIPSLIRGPAGGCAPGSKVWVKLRLGREDEKERRWYQYMGEIESECHQVRGSLKLKVRVPSLDGCLLVDPEFIDFHDVKKDPEAIGAYANRMLRECPAEAEALGGDVKCYHIPEGSEERLAACDGRGVADGRRIAQARAEEIKDRLPAYLRRHAMGCAEGIAWPAFPAEADLGIDRRVKNPRTEDGEGSGLQRMAVERGEAEDAKRCAEGAQRRSRSRSRSHSMTRIMREIDEGRTHEEPGEAEDEAIGMTEAYRVATNSGQSKEEAMATVEVVFEVSEAEVKRCLRSYLRRPATRRSQEVSEVCVQMLN